MEAVEGSVVVVIGHLRPDRDNEALNITLPGGVCYVVQTTAILSYRKSYG